MVEVACRVFNNRDVTDERKRTKDEKATAFLVVALQASGNLGTKGGRPPWVNNPDPHHGTNQRRPAKLETDQCAYCRHKDTGRESTTIVLREGTKGKLLILVIPDRR